MTTFQINSYNSFNTSAIVRESDKYSQLVYLKFIRSCTEDDRISCSDMLLTADELEKFGKFLVKQAESIQRAQDARHGEYSL